MTFIHQPFDFEELDSVTKEGKGRYYIRGDKKYESVTTVLSRRLDKGQLHKWRERVGAEQAAKITAQAARRGSSLHKICEKYVLNDSQHAQGAMSSNLILFNRVKPILDKHVSIVHNSEACLYSDRLKAAGRCDLICQYDNQLSIVDFKSSTKPKRLEWIESYLLQCTCYAMMLYEMKQLAAKQFVVIIGCEQLKEPQVFMGKTEDYISRVVEVFNG